MDYYVFQYAEIDKAPDESPYIGKSRYKRNMFAMESYIVPNAQAVQIKLVEPPEGGQPGNEPANPRVCSPLGVQLEDKEKQINTGWKEFFKILEKYKKDWIYRPAFLTSFSLLVEHADDIV